MSDGEGTSLADAMKAKGWKPRGPIGAWLGLVLIESMRRTADRRARVLRHPDLAAALCAPPLNYRKPEDWNGYIPPRTGQALMPEVLHSQPAYGSGDGGRTNAERRHTGGTETNETGERAMLVLLAAEALRRDAEAGLCDAGGDPDILAAHPFPFPGMRGGDAYTSPVAQHPLPPPGRAGAHVVDITEPRRYQEGDGDG